jgi:hypothetical protein
MVRVAPERGQEPVQNGYWRARGELRAFMERRLPELLQSSRELGPHPGRDVAVDAAHAGHLVPHALGLQDVPDAYLVEPCLVAVPQAVCCQPGPQRQP